MKTKKHKAYYKRQFLEPSKEGAADSYLITSVSLNDWSAERLGQRDSAHIKAADCNRSIEWHFYFDNSGKLKPASKKKLDKIIKQLEDFRTACTS